MKTQNQAAYTLADLKAAAYGRWPEIHAALGIDPRYLNPRRHCPCPRCGGKDRYRYTDYQGRGGFICNQCYPEGGSGFDLLMLVFGYDFAEAARQVAAVLGLAGGHAERHTPRPMPVPTPAKLQPDYLPAMLSWWEEAFPLADGDPVTGYLKTRGLPLPEPPRLCTAQRRNTDRQRQGRPARDLQRRYQPSRRLCRSGNAGRLAAGAWPLFGGQQPPLPGRRCSLGRAAGVPVGHRIGRFPPVRRQPRRQKHRRPPCPIRVGQPIRPHG